MAFFEYSQNNSGGSFVEDARGGIGEYVIIEADSASEANSIAEGIGIYFYSIYDCPCCGARWSAAWDDEVGDDVPSHYGVPLEDGNVFRTRWPSWTTPAGYIHFKDGRVEEITYAKEIEPQKEIES
jgi:hypothetical protein